jgi:carbon monoxide dehydrogenase subunit G
MRNPDVAKQSPSWVPVAAVLVALQGCGCAVAGHAGDNQNGYDLGRPLADRGDAGAKFDPGLIYVKSRGVAVNDAQAGKWDRLPAIPVGSVADEIKVHTALTADGKAVQVAVTLVLQVNPEVVRAVLNDYENMPRFVPDILATRLISEGSGRKRVEIEGVARLLFLDVPTRTTLDAVDRPDGSVAIDSVAGNLAIHGIVRMQGDGPYTRVDYEVRLTPDFWLPPLIGEFLVGRQITRQFEGMVAEMHRRADRHQTQGPALPQNARRMPPHSLPAGEC